MDCKEQARGMNKTKTSELQETGPAIAEVFRSVVVILRRKGDPGCIMNRNAIPSKAFSGPSTIDLPSGHEYTCICFA